MRSLIGCLTLTATGCHPYTDCDNQDPTIGTRTVYPDVDGDGYGDETGAEWGCTAEAGWSMEPGDCDDGDARRLPRERRDLR
jgi:hypothetical protein